MATHRNGGAADSGVTGYPGQPYPNSGYPSFPTGYPSRPAETTAERIPRHPDPGRGSGPTPRRDEELRLIADDIPPPHLPDPYPAGPSEQPAQPTPSPPPAAPGIPAHQQQPPAQPAGPGHQWQPSVPSAGPGYQQPPAGASDQQRPGPRSPAAESSQTPLSDLLHDPTQYTEPVAAYPSGRPPGSGGARSAQLRWGLALLAVLSEAPVAVVLVRSLLAANPAVSGVVACLLLLPGIPLFAAGVFGLFTGRIAVRAGEGVAALTRRPLATLLLGIVLLVAAGLAA